MLRREGVEIEPLAAENDVDGADLVAKEKTLGTSTGRLTRLQLKRLCRETFGLDWDAKWACIRSGTAPPSTSYYEKNPDHHNGFKIPTHIF